MLISFLQYSVSYLHSTKNTLKNTKTYAANLDKKAIRVFCCSNSARGGHLVLWVGSISTRDGHTLFKTRWWGRTVNYITFVTLNVKFKHNQKNKNIFIDLSPSIVNYSCQCLQYFCGRVPRGEVIKSVPYSAARPLIVRRKKCHYYWQVIRLLKTFNIKKPSHRVLNKKLSKPGDATAVTCTFGMILSDQL